MAPTKPKPPVLKQLRQASMFGLRLNPGSAAAMKRKQRQTTRISLFNSDFRLEETECEDERAPHRLHEQLAYFEVSCPSRDSS